jgi:hypothetical protein
MDLQALAKSQTNAGHTTVGTLILDLAAAAEAAREK